MAGRERSQSVEAVVLRHNDWGEADRLLSLFSREHGKIRAVAKGVRKIHSRKAGHLEPFTRVNLMLSQGQDLWIVTQADTVEAYLPLTQDLVRTGYASYVVELLERFSYEEGENRSIYNLLVETLGRVAGQADPYLAVRYYEVRLLDLVGFRPNLFQCVQCQAEIQPEDQYFSAQLGGVLCPRCGLIAGDARRVTQTTLKYLRHLQRSSFKDASRAKPDAATRAELENLIQYYLTYLLERNLNSPGFIKEVRDRTRGR